MGKHVRREGKGYSPSQNLAISVSTVLLQGIFCSGGLQESVSLTDVLSDSCHHGYLQIRVRQAGEGLEDTDLFGK